jgi:hypothetical protein
VPSTQLVQVVAEVHVAQGLTQLEQVASCVEPQAVDAYCPSGHVEQGEQVAVLVERK